MNSIFTIEELFSGKVLLVPDYQRGYAWEEKQWDDFLDDLEYLGDGKHHYTGTVVLDPQPDVVRDEEGRGNKAYHVVDGQQRLTTVVVLLETIRARIAEFNPTLAAGIRKSYIEFRDLNQQRSHKLRLNSDSHDYFVGSILAEPSSPEGPMIASHKRLKGAKAHFCRYLEDREKVEGSRFSEWIVRFYEKVIQQLRVSQYVVEQSSEVGVIFEVMNNRGKPLSELDKAKNYLMYLASKLEVDEPHHIADQINSTWAEIFRRLMASGLNSSADEDRLLRAHWLMVYDSNPREWSGSDSIKQRYNLKCYQSRHPELLSGLSDYVKSLRSAVVPFCESFRPAHSDAFGVFSEPARSEVKKAGEKLRRLKNVAPFVPLLTACRLRFPVDPEKYLELLKLAEIFAFRVYRVMQKRADAGQALLFDLGNLLFHDEVSFGEVLVRVRHCALSHCSNADLRENAALDESESEWYLWNTLKYVLYEYEEHLAGSKGVKVSWDVFDSGDPQRTIEHILPQTVDGGNGKYWRDRFDRQQRRRLTHDIGNLCLTEDNSAYGNKPYPAKKGEPGAGKCYANSSLLQERELAREADWTEEAILKRRGRIIAWYLQRWHLDDSDFADGQVESEDYLSQF